MKAKLTSTDINLIQHVCESIAYGNEVTLSEDGTKIAKRISQITSNLIMSEDNQVDVDESPVEDNGAEVYFINDKPHFETWVRKSFIGDGRDYLNRKTYRHHSREQVIDIYELMFD